MLVFITGMRSHPSTAPQHHTTGPRPRAPGLLSLSGSLVSLLSPVFAAAVLALLGLEAVIAFDLLTRGSASPTPAGPAPWGTAGSRAPR